MRIWFPERRRKPSPGHGEPPPGPPALSGSIRSKGTFKAIALGLITGAADDDPSAIGTYASAGAKFGPAFLWTAPVTLPMMFAVVYLSSRLGQVSGEGLFSVIRDNYPRWVLYWSLIGVLLGNTFEAAADIGGMAAALNIFLDLPSWWIVVPITLVILAVQLFGTYTLIREILRWLALVLLAYVGSAALAKPDLMPVLKGTFIPTIQFNLEFMSMLVAVMGTTLSAYLYTWQSNEEVEEQIAMGRKRLEDRKGATPEELRQVRKDILLGMAFSNLVMDFIILSTASTLHKSGHHNIETAAQAAEAMRPLAGDAAGALFAIGVIAVGMLAVPIMTTGAAYDICQALHWKHGLYRKPSEAKAFYALIVTLTLIAMACNFLGFNPMKALVWAGVVQGFSTAPLLLLIVLMTNNPAIMGDKVNSRGMNFLGWLTTLVTFLASIGLCVAWLVSHLSP